MIYQITIYEFIVALVALAFILFCVTGFFFSIPALMSHCFNNLGLARDTIFGPYNRSRVSHLQCPSCGWTAPPQPWTDRGHLPFSPVKPCKVFQTPDSSRVGKFSFGSWALCATELVFSVRDVFHLAHPTHVHGWGVILRVWSTPESISTLAASSHLK